MRSASHARGGGTAGHRSGQRRPATEYRVLDMAGDPLEWSESACPPGGGPLSAASACVPRASPTTSV